MKKLKATAVVCGALAAVCVGAPAFADDGPSAPASSASLDPQALHLAGLGLTVEQAKQMMTNPDTGAYGTLGKWIQERDEKQLENVLGKSDSELLGLHVFGR